MAYGRETPFNLFKPAALMERSHGSTGTWQGNTLALRYCTYRVGVTAVRDAQYPVPAIPIICEQRGGERSRARL